ncbi:MAG: hypothetical protein HQ567_21775 [Candidatus Nealsonbacteria bacterium]|nr:hypothetical protein [Candidatus Nealsonbacteria bacterium]
MPATDSVYRSVAIVNTDNRAFSRRARPARFGTTSVDRNAPGKPGG